jgi:hypothetical protein
MTCRNVFTQAIVSAVNQRIALICQKHVAYHFPKMLAQIACTFALPTLDHLHHIVLQSILGLFASANAEK